MCLFAAVLQVLVTIHVIRTVDLVAFYSAFVAFYSASSEIDADLDALVCICTRTNEPMACVQLRFDLSLR